MSKLMLASMLVLGWTLVPRPAFAEAKCPTGNAPIFEDDLRAAPTCEAAHKLHEACSWGSSGDAGLSGAVIEKCEATFLSHLTPAQKKNYEGRQQRCADKYSREDGSEATSEASLCAAEVSAAFARNVAARSVPAAPLAPVKASFDCAKAQTKLEQLICSSDVIGGEDIDLTAAYRKAFRSAAQDARKALIASQNRRLVYVANACIGGAVGDNDSKDCGEQAFSDRTEQLPGCMAKSGEAQTICLNAYAPVINGSAKRSLEDGLCRERANRR